MIDAGRVEFMIRDCLFKNEEVEDGKPKNPDDMIVVQGIMNDFGLHKGRVEGHKAEIVSYLGQLPENFMKDTGGGWSFLNACNTNKGEQWTGLHRTMEALFVLGMAIGKASYVLPREKWQTFPGDMPYIVVDLEGGEDERAT